MIYQSKKNDLNVLLNFHDYKEIEKECEILDEDDYYVVINMNMYKSIKNN